MFLMVLIHSQAVMLWVHSEVFGMVKSFSMQKEYPRAGHIYRKIFKSYFVRRRLVYKQTNKQTNTNESGEQWQPDAPAFTHDDNRLTINTFVRRRNNISLSGDQPYVPTALCLHISKNVLFTEHFEKLGPFVPTFLRFSLFLRFFSK